MVLCGLWAATVNAEDSRLRATMNNHAAASTAPEGGNDNFSLSNEDGAFSNPKNEKDRILVDENGTGDSGNGDDVCPPKIVIANALHHYCPQGFVVDGVEYTCFDDDGETPICTGTIDYIALPPPCPLNIQSCTDFEQVCEPNPEVDLCNVETDTFECWQPSAEIWCQGEIVRNETTASECPTFDVISDCDDLYNLLDNADLCVCDDRTVPDEGGPGSHNETVYECKKHGGIDAPVVCSGTVDPVNGNRDPFCPPAVASLDELNAAGCNTTFPNDALTYHYSCNVAGIEGSVIVCGGTVILGEIFTPNETAPLAPLSTDAPSISLSPSTSGAVGPAPGASSSNPPVAQPTADQQPQSAPVVAPVVAPTSNPPVAQPTADQQPQSSPVVAPVMATPSNPPVAAPVAQPTTDQPQSTPVAAPVEGTSPSAFSPSAYVNPSAPVLFHDDDSLPTVDSNDGLYNQGGDNDSNGVFMDIWAIGNTTLLLFMGGFAVMFVSVWIWRRRQRQKRYRGDQFYSGIESHDGDYEMQPTYRMAHEDYGGW